MKPTTALIVSLLLLISAEGQAQGARADSHAPVGIFGGHTHKQGEWLLSYSLYSASLPDLLDTEQYIDASNVIDANGYGFSMTATSMRKLNHRLGLLYGFSDQLTLGISTRVIDNEMSMLASPADGFTISSSGIGDTELGLLYQISSKDNASLIFNLDLSLPTGEIDELGPRASNGSATNLQPYAMQLGSGTNDISSGFTFQFWADAWSWGNQVKYTHRLDDNDAGYALGDRLSVSSWSTKLVSQKLSISARLQYDKWQDIEGRDSRLSPSTSPMDNAKIQAGEQAALAIGANVLMGSNRFALEFSIPLWQRLQGPQLAESYSLTLGLKRAF